MKKVLLVVGMLVGVSANAAVIKTSSASVNPAFPKTTAEIMAIDRASVDSAATRGEETVGDFQSYECTADSSDNSLTCVFAHDLPYDWCWYGHFNVTYKNVDGTVTVSQDWAQ